MRLFIFAQTTFPSLLVLAIVCCWPIETGSASTQAAQENPKRRNEAIKPAGAEDVASFKPGDGNCDRRYFNGRPDRIVCACSEKYCDNFALRWPENFGEVYVYETTESGKRFKFKQNEKQPAESGEWPTIDREITLDVNKEHQSILGWGGGFTGATGAVISSLSPEMSVKLMESYFGKNGSQYNMGRVPMGGTDYSPYPQYNYADDYIDDWELENWDLSEEDYSLKIPFILKAMEMVKTNEEEAARELKLMFSPWGVTKWLTDNNSIFMGHLKNDLAYRTRALSFMKFMESYRQNGIKFWGASVQNQPIKMISVPMITSLLYCNNEMIKFITEYLGPMLEASGYGKGSGFKLMAGDDCLGLMDAQVPVIMNNTLVQRYISALAFHFYYDGTDGIPYSDIDRLYKPFERKPFEFLLMSEACESNSPGAKRTDPGEWARGQHYASDIIEDLLRDTGGWMDWNLAVDMAGGPNNIHLGIDACISVDESKNEFYKLPTYYALAHFSRFFKPDSMRIQASPIDDFNQSQRDLLYVSVKNKKTNHLILNILNRAQQAKRIKILIKGLSETDYEIESIQLDAKSLTSILIKI